MLLYYNLAGYSPQPPPSAYRKAISPDIGLSELL